VREFDHRPGVFLVKFNGPTFTEDLAFIKQFVGNRFDKKLSCWIITANKGSWTALLEKGFTPILEATKLIKPAAAPLSLPEGLRPYQVEGVTWLFRRRGRGYLADDMGLGKTVQAAVLLKELRLDRPVLIVCPATMKVKWQRELLKWTGLQAEILYGRTPAPILPTAPFYIINYDILGYEDEDEQKQRKEAKAQAKALNQPFRPRALPVYGWCEVLSDLGLAGWVADEAHHLQDPKTIQVRAFKMIHKSIQAPQVILPMSGTPIDDKPVQFFTTLNMIAPDLFPNEWSFKNRYCAPKNNGFGTVFTGASHIPELRTKLKTVMLRRLKVDVLTDLPAKQRIVVPMELSPVESRKYVAAGEAFRDWLRLQKTLGIEAQEQAHNLTRLAYAAKRNAVMTWIREYLDTGQKLVVGAWYHTAIDDLVSVFGKEAIMMDGSVPSSKRQELEDRFQNDKKIRLFIGQIKAAGEGLTLTAAPATALVEFGQTSGQHNQFEDRVHRIGQTADSVFAYYLLGQGTLDDDLMDALEYKNKVSKSILDGTDDAVFFDRRPIIGDVLAKLKGEDN
jgi:SWI/SNF-related matrix-associated actin-dependent regulator 1 of chromatin subfamily A